MYQQDPEPVVAHETLMNTRRIYGIFIDPKIEESDRIIAVYGHFLDKANDQLSKEYPSQKVSLWLDANPNDCIVSIEFSLFGRAISKKLFSLPCGPRLGRDYWEVTRKGWHNIFIEEAHRFIRDTLRLILSKGETTKPDLENGFYKSP